MKERKSTAAPILAAVLILALPLGAYVGGYFLLGNRVDVIVPESGALDYTVRIYPAQWLATMFRPMAQLESWLSGEWIATLGGTLGGTRDESS